MVEPVDTTDLKSVDRKIVRVQVPPALPLSFFSNPLEVQTTNPMACSLRQALRRLALACFLLGLAACAEDLPSRQCCDCLERNQCLLEDHGVCTADEDCGSDSDDGVLDELFDAACRGETDPEALVSHRCAKTNGCLPLCRKWDDLFTYR